MTQITAEKKDEIFRHPKAGTIHYGRHMSVVSRDADTWAAVQMGEGRQTRILLLHQCHGQDRQLILGPDGMIHQPSLALNATGQVVVVWNQAVDTGWEIRCAHVDEQQKKLQPYHTIHRSDDLCLPPTVASDEHGLWVAWAGLVDGRMTIHATHGMANDWQPVARVSTQTVDAFRPHLSARAGRVILAWDEYSEKRYQVIVAQHHHNTWSITGKLGQPDERYLHPRTAILPDGRAFVVLVALKPVVDKLGIIDHWPMGLVARIEENSLIMLYDQSHPSDPRIIADLRDGLLASKIYKGYVGLRRNPFLSVNVDGQLWCVWEIRGESQGSTVAGPLLARRLHDDGTWSPVQQIAEAGYGYAVAPCFRDQLPFAFMQFDQHGLDVIAIKQSNPSLGAVHVFDEKHWQRWHAQSITPEPPIEKTVTANGQDYHVFWGDTHVHSVLSPDAEGELDELVHFARDQAGLNILTIIDNDYYPHKALTEPEWRIHQAMARHFSEDGKFLWLPGYEFTYHRGDLTPDFNHRCVSYPLGQGPLHRRIDPDINTDSKMIPILKAAGAMVYPHHCTYVLIDNDSEWNVEVTSSWRVCIEETDFTIKQLQAGKRLGFIGSSDTHRGLPGLGGARTGVLVTELTRAAVMDAYRNRRLFATQGHNLFVDFSINGQTVGSTVQTDQAPDIHVNIIAPLPLDYVELVCDGDVIYRVLARENKCCFAYQPEPVPTGETRFYFLRIKMLGDPSFNRDSYDPATNDPRPFSQDSRYPHNLARARGPFAWASPIWVCGV